MIPRLAWEMFWAGEQREVWFAEAVGSEGERYRVEFSGREAEFRCRDYLNWQVEAYEAEIRPS